MLSTHQPCQLLRHLTWDWGHPSPSVTARGAALPCKFLFLLTKLNESVFRDGAIEVHFGGVGMQCPWRGRTRVMERGLRYLGCEMEGDTHF